MTHGGRPGRDARRPLPSGDVYGFLRRPRWIALTALTLVLMVLMVNLSLWQVRRLDERKDANRAIRANAALAPAPVDEVLPPTATLADIGDAEWRTVSVTGTYDVAHQVLVNDRSYTGFPGLHVVTPLVLADGRGLLINRGWVPAPTTLGAEPDVPAPPTGTVTVLGRIRPTQTRGWLGPKDKATGTLARVARVDVARIGAQTPYPLLPAYAEVVAADDGSTLPRPLPLPELDEGPHLSYAGQWLLFTILAGVGWVAMVRRQARLQRQAARRAELAAAAASTDAAVEADTVTAAASGPATGDRPSPGAGAATTGPGGTAGS